MNISISPIIGATMLAMLVNTSDAAPRASANSQANGTTAVSLTSTTVALQGASGQIIMDSDHWAQSCATGQVLESYFKTANAGNPPPPVSSLSTSGGYVGSPGNFDWFVETRHEWILCNQGSGEIGEGFRITKADTGDC